ncbi:MAG: branched-chain amino acid ABC transporter permease [Phycisphaerales bacterium]|nr:branched-chain amino acid ABC transporter permease [Phycisphaerales bacterium]
MDRFLQTLMDGVAVGSLYALIALGYTMVYGILQFINFAHGDVFVLGAWVSFAAAGAVGLSVGDQTAVPAWLVWLLGAVSAGALAAALYEFVLRPRLGAGRPPATRLTWPLAGVSVVGWGTLLLLVATRGVVAGGSHTIAGGMILVLAMSTCGLVGFCLERLAYKPLRSAPRLNVLITAIGVSLLLQNLGQLEWMFGTRPDRMPTLVPDTVLFRIGHVPVRLVDVMVVATALVLMVLLDWLVFRTKMGRAMRAVSFSPTNAALMGVDVDKVISFTFVLGSVLAAAAGFLYGQKYPGLNQTAAAGWVLLGLKAFVAAVIGGIGNIRGAMLGGLLIGLLEFFAVQYVPEGASLRDIFVFGALILVLLVRPSGVLGKAVTEKV